jgi:hypothetical protein
MVGIEINYVYMVLLKSQIILELIEHIIGNVLELHHEILDILHYIINLKLIILLNVVLKNICEIK